MSMKRTKLWLDAATRAAEAFSNSSFRGDAKHRIRNVRRTHPPSRKRNSRIPKRPYSQAPITLQSDSHHGIGPVCTE